MTNFEHMKKRVLDAVSALDEEELWQFVTDTCMDERDAEGIFSCGLCEGVFGDCDVIPGRNGCMKKYLKWCAAEYVPAQEDRKVILTRLAHLIKATRAGSGVRNLALSEDGNKVIIQFAHGSRDVNIECDSGYAMIMDVMKAL